ncbi:MAG: RagB/SusD family nutrient uptake outer membrane protein [Candidatus Pseudobacter hemicellulosilyticus]|uniref:RagB/SusD family nutrient uptake outer membrane protein n=1 Tax=Candidatus Pseudobacter hemicellulosilyticus TaxID=3121375 RepID=A0AAJ6BJW8_9BACT|nr:MAG: RagB/SusD family nutrient uptake outer membrane protein [Pseudobacter sp.]
MKNIIIAISIILIPIFSACEKMVEIPAPANSITTTEIFKDSTTGEYAMAGIYSKIYYPIQGENGFGTGFLTRVLSSYTDESAVIQGNAVTAYYNNTITSTNTSNFNGIWALIYAHIYHINACVDGINRSTGLTTNLKNKYLAECLFLRSWLYYYLVGLYSDVPYITDIDWESNIQRARNKVNDIYGWISADLEKAQTMMPLDYKSTRGTRTRVNHFAISALLSRIYLTTGNYDKCIQQASALLNNIPDLGLEDNLTNVFSPGSKEAILQFDMTTSRYPFNMTYEASNAIPYPESIPNTFLTTTLLHQFSAEDKRWITWIDSTQYEGKMYYYAKKYRIGVNNYAVNGPKSELYTVLRLSEQYLNRAEAKIRQNNFEGAAADINTIRHRAGLADTTITSVDQGIGVLLAERQREFFYEWGYRFFDLKRNNKLDEKLTGLKPNWRSYMQILPIPLGELQSNSLLTQNPQY